MRETEGGMGLDKYLDCGCGCAGLKKSDMVKFKFAFYSGILFLLISSPFMYKVTSSALGRWVAGPGGSPTSAGLILHTVVFILISFLLMKIRT
jgi:hypothetical protein